MADPFDDLLDGTVAKSEDKPSTAASADDLDDFFNDLGIGDSEEPTQGANDVDLDLDFGDMNLELDHGLNALSPSSAEGGNAGSPRKPGWSTLGDSEQDDFLSWLQEEDKDNANGPARPRKDTSYSIDSEDDDLPGITLESLAADPNNALAAAALAAVNAASSAAETFSAGDSVWNETNSEVRNEIAKSDKSGTPGPQQAQPAKSTTHVSLMEQASKRMARMKIPTMGPRQQQQQKQQQMIQPPPTLYEDVVWSAKVAEVVASENVSQSFSEKATEQGLPACLRQTAFDGDATGQENPEFEKVVAVSDADAALLEGVEDEIRAALKDDISNKADNGDRIEGDIATLSTRITDVIVKEKGRVAVVPSVLRSEVWHALLVPTSNADPLRNLADWEVNAIVGACREVIHVQQPETKADGSGIDEEMSGLVDEATAAIVRYCETTGVNFRTPLASLAMLVVCVCRDNIKNNEKFDNNNSNKKNNNKKNNNNNNNNSNNNEAQQQQVQSLLTCLAQEVGGFLCNDTYRSDEVHNEFELSVMGHAHYGAHVAWERQLAPHVGLQLRGFIRSLVVYYDPLLCLHLDHYLPNWFTPCLSNAPLHDQLAELTLKEYQQNNGNQIPKTAGSGNSSGNGSIDDNNFGSVMFGLFMPEGKGHLAKVLTDALLCRLPGFATAQSGGVFAALALLLIGRDRLLSATTVTELKNAVQELKNEAVNGSEANARVLVQVATAAAASTPLSFIKDVLNHELLLVPACSVSGRAVRSSTIGSVESVPKVAKNTINVPVLNPTESNRLESEGRGGQQQQPSVDAGSDHVKVDVVTDEVEGASEQQEASESFSAGAEVAQSSTVSSLEEQSNTETDTSSTTTPSSWLAGAVRQTGQLRQRLKQSLNDGGALHTTYTKTKAELQQGFTKIGQTGAGLGFNLGSQQGVPFTPRDDVDSVIASMTSSGIDPSFIHRYQFQTLVVLDKHRPLGMKLRPSEDRGLLSIAGMFRGYNGETLQAEEHGLTVGDVLLTVNGVSVASLDGDDLNVLITNQDYRLDMIFLLERVREAGAETMRESGESQHLQGDHLQDHGSNVDVDIEDQHAENNEEELKGQQSPRGSHGGGEVAIVSSRVPGLGECLQTFYAREQPAKVKAVEAILKVYHMREHSLLLEMATKYGRVVDGDPNRLPGRGVRFGLPMGADEVVVQVYGEKASPSALSSVLDASTKDSSVSYVAEEKAVPVVASGGVNGTIGGKLKTFVVDCRTDEQIAQTGRFPTSFRVNMDDKEGTAMSELTQTFESLRGRVRVCILGDGADPLMSIYAPRVARELYLQDRARVESCALHMVSHGFPFVCVAEGGFAACYIAMRARGMDPGELLVDRQANGLTGRKAVQVEHLEQFVRLRHVKPSLAAAFVVRAARQLHKKDTAAMNARQVLAGVFNTPRGPVLATAEAPTPAQSGSAAGKGKAHVAESTSIAATDGDNASINKASGTETKKEKTKPAAAGGGWSWGRLKSSVTSASDRLKETINKQQQIQQPQAFGPKSQSPVEETQADVVQRSEELAGFRKGQLVQYSRFVFQESSPGVGMSVGSIAGAGAGSSFKVSKQKLNSSLSTTAAAAVALLQATSTDYSERRETSSVRRVVLLAYGRMLVLQPHLLRSGYGYVKSNRHVSEVVRLRFRNQDMSSIYVFHKREKPVMVSEIVNGNEKEQIGKVDDPTLKVQCYLFENPRKFIHVLKLSCAAQKQRQLSLVSASDAPTSPMQPSNVEVPVELPAAGLSTPGGLGGERSKSNPVAELPTKTSAEPDDQERRVSNQVAELPTGTSTEPEDQGGLGGGVNLVAEQSSEQSTEPSSELLDESLASKEKKTEGEALAPVSVTASSTLPSSGGVDVKSAEADASDTLAGDSVAVMDADMDALGAGNIQHANVDVDVDDV